MIPLKLTLRNFMCYRENVPPLDLSGIHLACLSGDNGHGKSALLDAMTWALWGRSRAKTEDELIHLGADEMEVELEFLLAGNHYRVLRKRQRRKTASVAGLELQVRDGDTFRAITGNTIADTEKQITKLLRMDYDTFINSAFLLQGRADEFTVKRPAERKQVLADILGLGLYDQLEETAKEQARSYETQRKALVQSIAEIDSELDKEDTYRQELAAAQQESARMATALTEAEETLRSLRDQKNALDLKAAHLRDLEARISRTERDITNAQAEATARSQRLAEYEAILAQRTRIEESYAALQKARAENDVLNQALSRIAQLQAQEHQVERQVETARSRLVADQRAEQERIKDLTARCQKGAGREDELASLRAALAALDEQERQLDAMRQSLQELTSQVAALRHANDELKVGMNELKSKLDALAGVTHCPLCNTPLTETEREQVRGNYLEEGKRKGDTYRRNETEIKGLEQETSRLRAAIAESEGRLRERPSLQRREATLAQILADSQAAGEQLAAAQARLAAIAHRLDTGDYAPAEQARLADIRRQVAGLGYDAARHEQVRALVAELSYADSEKSNLETALHQIDGERATLARLQASLAAWEKELQSDRGQAATLRSELAALPTITANLRAQQATVDDLQMRERYARERLGIARQRLEHCDYLRSLRKEKVEAEEVARNERSLYEELAVAFGKKGIQAMIIEQAVPEIETEANALLARMTDGRMNVKFETQRDTKKGDTIETLDIKLSDEVGTRNYEMYSGGETFRANFAIRIALSKLLARRAGAQLQTLIIDEGFGTQDSRGRERLVEAINSIAKDFEKILVITHIEELKDAFPVRIEVTKTPQGSQIMVT